MTGVRELADGLARRQDEFVEHLRALASVDCGSRDKEGVDEAGRRFATILSDCGFAVDTLPLEDRGDCLRARVRSGGAGRLLLLGHLDTVYPGGTCRERPVAVAGDRILGPGCNDMKAGLLAGAYAVRELLERGFADFESITFFCNSDEEIGSRASFPLYRQDVLRADAVLVLEAARADGSIVSARKGGGHFTLSVSGRAAHAGVEPEKGANAILELAKRIVAVSAVQGLRPGTTVSVGAVEGGIATNVIPDRARADIDVRVVESGDIPIVEAALRRAAEADPARGTETRLDGRIALAPMVKTPAVQALVDLARELAGQLGFVLNDVTTGGMSDANRVAALGRPVLDGLGPVGGMDHSPEEYVELPSIVPRTALLAGLIQAALCVPHGE